jgi:hypothetical protein
MSRYEHSYWRGLFAGSMLKRHGVPNGTTF